MNISEFTEQELREKLTKNKLRLQEIEQLLQNEELDKRKMNIVHCHTYKEGTLRREVYALKNEIAEIENELSFRASSPKKNKGLTFN